MATASDFAGQILTVTGAIDPGDLGVTMAHEHILLYFNAVNELGDLDAESYHVSLYSRTDGVTLLSLSNRGLRWDSPGAPAPPFAPRTFVEAMRKVSIDGGARIVLGTGFYRTGVADAGSPEHEHCGFRAANRRRHRRRDRRR